MCRADGDSRRTIGLILFAAGLLCGFRYFLTCGSMTTIPGFVDGQDGVLADQTIEVPAAAGTR